MDKLILVVYINIGNLSHDDVDDYMSLCVARIKHDHKDDEIEYYFIPVRTGESRIECVNPKLVGGKEYKEITKKLEILEKRIDELTKTND